MRVVSTGPLNLFGRYFMAFIILTGCFLPALSSFQPLLGVLKQALPITLIHMTGFYWRHWSFPVCFFLMGLWLDLLSGAPLGFFALIFLTSYAAGRIRRHYFLNKNFLSSWMGFTWFWAAIILLQVQMLSWFGEIAFDIHLFLWDVALGVALFPALYLLVNEARYWFAV